MDRLPKCSLCMGTSRLSVLMFCSSSVCKAIVFACFGVTDLLLSTIRLHPPRKMSQILKVRHDIQPVKVRRHRYLGECLCLFLVRRLDSDQSVARLALFDKDFRRMTLTHLARIYLTEESQSNPTQSLFLARTNDKRH